LRQQGSATQRPAGDGDAADAGNVLSPQSSESSGVGSKQSSLDNLLYIERKQHTRFRLSFTAFTPGQLSLSSFQGRLMSIKLQLDVSYLS